MILSNTAIVDCLSKGIFEIQYLSGMDPTQPPFNTSAVDLRLGTEINVLLPGAPLQIDLSVNSGIAKLLHQNSERIIISKSQPYKLEPNKLILAQTMEVVDFKLSPQNETSYSARVEGKSSLARCGILVHFTAPTIHAGFSGPITLEIINLGPFSISLSPEMFICQLIIEEVQGAPKDAENQFKNQSNPAGVV